MTRIALKSDSDLPPETKLLFDGMMARGSKVPDLYRLLANAPDLLQAWTDLAWPLRSSDHVPRSLRELLIMRTAHLLDAKYEWAHHWPLALSAGITEIQLKAIPVWKSEAVFSELERAALAVTDELVEAGHVDASTFAELAAKMEPAGLIHVVLTISFYICVARFAHAFELDLEPSFASIPPVRRAS